MTSSFQKGISSNPHAFSSIKKEPSHCWSPVPVTLALFLSLINYARQHGCDGILAVSSHPMLHIIKAPLERHVAEDRHIGKERACSFAVGPR